MKRTVKFGRRLGTQTRKYFDANFFDEDSLKDYIAKTCANPQEAGKKTRRRKRKKRRKRTKKKRRRRTKKKRRRRR